VGDTKDYQRVIDLVFTVSKSGEVFKIFVEFLFLSMGDAAVHSQLTTLMDTMPLAYWCIKGSHLQTFFGERIIKAPMFLKNSIICSSTSSLPWTIDEDKGQDCLTVLAKSNTRQTKFRCYRHTQAADLIDVISKSTNYYGSWFLEDGSPFPINCTIEDNIFLKSQ